MSHLDAVIYAPDGATFLARVASPVKLSALEEYVGSSGGFLTVHADDPQLAAVPGLLADRNVVKVRVDGTPVAAFIIRERDTVVVDAGGDAGRTITVTGPSLDAWLTEALVYAESQTPYSGDVRWFNFGSKTGAWFVPDEWGLPSVVRQLTAPEWYDAANPWKMAPANWPKVEPPDTPAAWVWASSDAWRGADPGDCYFRYEFTTPEGGRDYRLFLTADNAAQVVLDGQPLSYVNDAAAWQNAWSVNFSLAAGTHVLGIKVRNLGGPAGLLADLYAVARAGTDTDQLFPVTRTGADGWTICAYPYREPGWTFGEVLTTLLAEASARGVTSIAALTGASFTASVDTAGQPWAKRTLKARVGDTIAAVCAGQRDFGIRVHVDPDTLAVHAWNGRAAAKPAAMLDAPINVEALSEKVSSQLVTALLVAADGQWGGAVAASPAGRIEAHLNASGLPPADAAALSRLVLDKARIPEESVTLTYTPTGDDVPWRDYTVGDPVRVRSADGYRTRLVVSITVTLGDDGAPRYQVELDSPYRDLLDRLARATAALGADHGNAAGKVQPRTDTTGPGDGSYELPGGALPGDEWPGTDDPADPYDGYPAVGDPDWPGDIRDPDNPWTGGDGTRPAPDWPASGPADTEHGRIGDDGKWHEGTSGGWYDSEGNWHTGHPAGWYDADNTWHEGARPGEGTFDADGKWHQTGAGWTDDAAGSHDGSPEGWFDSGGTWREGVSGGWYDADGTWHPLEAGDYPKSEDDPSNPGLPGDPGDTGAGWDYTPADAAPGGEYPSPNFGGGGGDPVGFSDPDLGGAGFGPADPVLQPPEGFDPWAPPSDPTGNTEGAWDVGQVSATVATDALALWEGYADAVAVCLLTAEPAKTDGVWAPLESVEVTGGGYARAEVPWASFDPATGTNPVKRATSLAVDIGPNTDTEPWPTCTHVALIVGTAIRSVIPLATPITVAKDQIFQIAAGGLQITSASVA